MRIGFSSGLLAVLVSGSASLLACSSTPDNDIQAQVAAATEQAACSLSYKVVSQWETGFTGDVSFTNPGPAPLASWEVSWDYTDGQTVTSLWDGQLTSGGPHVSAKNPSWAGSVAVGSTVHFGFNGASSGTNGAPKNFKINGIGCGGEAPPTTPPTTPTTPDAGTTPPATPDAGTTTPPTGPSVPPPAGQRVVAYFTAWGIYARNYQIANIPTDKITHINYAFANISSEGECALGDSYADTDKAFPGDTWDQGVLRGNFNQMIQLKKAHPALKTLISVGGWTWSGKFSDVASTAAGRTKFASSCVTFMKKYGFDGIDLDWEYPVGGGLAGNSNRPEDKGNYTLLLSEIRQKMDALGDGEHHLLTIAAPAGPSIIKNMDLPALAGPLDWINMMTYDYHGGWETQTNHNAPLYPMAGDTTKFSVDDAVTAYLAGGVAAKKLTMGVPLYGRGWAGVPSANNGLLQTSSGLPTGSWEPGVFDYKDIKSHYLNNGYTRYWNSDAKVPWLYNPSTQIMITYDDTESMTAKAQYIKAKGLGGGMAWELSGDDGTLLDALNAGMR